MTQLSRHGNLNQRDWLLAEEQLLAARLSVLRGRLNDMAPISSLPPEVMEEIFHYCVACLYDTQPLKCPLAWTQVCCQWRAISLSSTRLWQRIDLCNARFAKQFLLRSKQAPLSIVSTSLLKYHFDSTTINSNQLTSIDVFLFHADMIHLFSCIKDQLGSLTRLSLKVPPSKPLILQDVSFPKVQHLSLDGVIVNWEVFHDLLRLSLRGLSPDYLPSMSQLQGMLRRSPDLLSLRLENYIPAPHTNPYSDSSNLSRYDMDQTTTPILLPKLTELVICTNSSIASALFGVLSLGPAAKIQLFTSFDAKEDLHSLFPNGLPYSTSSFNHSRSNSGPCFVQRIRLSRSGLALIAQDNLNRPVDAWAESTPTHDVAIHKHQSTVEQLGATTILSISSASSSITSPLASRLCTSLPSLLSQQYSTYHTMHQITHLELNTGVLLDLPPLVLQTFFAQLPNLEGLAVGFNDLSGLLGVLGGITPLDTEKSQSLSSLPQVTPPQPLLPRLKRLTFSRPADLWWNFADRWLGLALKCLQSRYEKGVGLERVEFYRCHGICSESPSSSASSPLGWDAGLTGENLALLGKVKEVVGDVVVSGSSGEKVDLRRT